MHHARLRGFGNVDDNRTWTPCVCNHKCFLDYSGDVLRVGDKVGMLRNRACDSDHVRFLECVGSDCADADLTGDCDHGDRIRICVGYCCDKVCGSRTGGYNAYAGFARGKRIAFCRVTCRLLVPHKNKAEFGIVFNRVINRQNCAARNAENVCDSRFLQSAHDRLSARHYFACGQCFEILSVCRIG